MKNIAEYGKEKPMKVVLNIWTTKDQMLDDILEVTLPLEGRNLEVEIQVSFRKATAVASPKKEEKCVKGTVGCEETGVFMHICDVPT